MNRDLFLGINADDFFNNGLLHDKFVGLIDDVRIYNYALSESEIRNVMTGN